MPTDAPSPEPWKVALAEAVADLHLDVSYAEAGPLQRKAEALSLISRHHDPSCLGPTPTRTESLDDFVGLHQEITIIYVVDGYEAQLFTEDGQRLVCDAKGRTIAEALERLAEARKALEVKP